MTDTDQQQLDFWIVDKATGQIITDSAPARVVITHQETFEALAAVCKMTPADRDWHKMTKTERGMLNRASKELRLIAATPEQIHDFGAWFKVSDWRGKRGDPPMPTDVVKMWTRFKSSQADQPRDIAADWLRALGRNDEGIMK